MASPVDVREAYDRLSIAYDLIADPAETKARERGLALLAPAAGERALEIGSGTGRALVDLARAVGPGGEVCGLDLSAGMLRRARQRVAPWKRHVHLQQADARALPFFPACFDAVFMSFTLELFEGQDIELVLREIDRVLCRGGRVSIVSLASVPEPSFASEAFLWLHRHFPRWISCRPIDSSFHLERCGYRPCGSEKLSLWGLSVTVVVAQRGRHTAPSDGFAADSP